MSYSVPSYNAVNFNYTGGAYTPPSYNVVYFNYTEVPTYLSWLGVFLIVPF